MSALPHPLPATLSGRKKMGWNSPCQTSPCASSQSPSSARASRSGSHAQSLHASPAQTPPALRTAQSPRAVLRASHSQSPRAIRSQALPSVEKPLPRDSRVERPLSPSLFTADSSPQPPPAAAADPSVGLSQETVAISSAIAAALATLDGIGPSAQQDERISQALRYIAENPSIALASPPAAATQ